MLRRAAALLTLTSLIVRLSGGPVTDDGGSTAAGLDQGWRSKLIDPEDGWLDLSGFLDDAAGFVPLIVPITEPAVGFGLAAVPIFISKNDPAPDGTPVHPNITAIGGFMTDNGSEGLFGVHSGSWLDGKLDTTIGGLTASVNLDFYGLGDRANQYNIEANGGMVEALYRLGGSSFKAGLGYLYADMKVSFDNPFTGSDRFQLSSQLSGPKLVLEYDTRDNIFTPAKGSFANLSTSFNDPIFGASSSHQALDLTAYHFWPLRQNLIFGLRGIFQTTFGDTPFYALPFVKLRGVPVMRYQGESAASAEAEVRWQFWKRFSLVGFGGAGTARTDSGFLEGSESVLTGGGGFRYELARRYDLHMGIDLGFSNEGDSAIYFTFGSAWGGP